VGSVTQIMVIEGLRTFPGEAMGISTTEFERKRILGVAPVEADGSFNIRVPANTPISFNVLDDLGRSMVTKRNWIYSRPGEAFTKCVGCHDDRGKPADQNTLALQRPPTDLNTPVANREVVNFRDVVGPVVEAKCVSCHVPIFTTVFRDSMAAVDTIAAPGNLDLRFVAVYDSMENTTFPQAYLSLAGSEMETMQGPQVVTPGFSRRSPLIDWLLGVGSRAGQAAHPDAANTLTPAEKKQFMNWVDLGAQYK